MSKFEVLVCRVTCVEDHPSIKNLSLIHVNGKIVVSMKLEGSGFPRYVQDEFVVYCPVNSIIPDYLLKQGYWDEKKNKGCLGGSKGNRVKPRTFGKDENAVISEGILFPVEVNMTFENSNERYPSDTPYLLQISNGFGEKFNVTEGENVMNILWIEEYKA